MSAGVVILRLFIINLIMFVPLTSMFVNSPLPKKTSMCVGELRVRLVDVFRLPLTQCRRGHGHPKT
jgi:hypothetical protein